MEIKESKQEADFTFDSGRFPGTIHLFEQQYDVSQQFNASFRFWWGVGSLGRGPEILKEWGFEDVEVSLKDKRHGRARTINSFADCRSADGPHLTIALVGEWPLVKLYEEPAFELVIADARKDSESDVTVVFEVDGGQRQTEVFRREGIDADIVAWNTVGERDNCDLIDHHGKKVFQRLIGLAHRILAGENLEFPIVYKNEPAP